MKAFVIALAATLVSACSLPEARKYDPADNPKFALERYECERDARSINAPNCTQMELYETCMLAKGYKPIHGTGNKGLCATL